MFCSFKSGLLIAAAALGAALSGGVEVYDSESTGALRRTN
jgi:hypothetical protein